MFCKLTLLQFEVAFSDSAASVQDQSSSFYTAAVVELFAPGLQFKDPQDVVEANLAEYLRLVKEAKSKGADILVFAEATLNYFGNHTGKLLKKNFSELFSMDQKTKNFKSNFD